MVPNMPRFDSLSVGCRVTANFGASQFKYAPSAADFNCLGGFYYFDWQLNNELEKVRVQQESDRSKQDDKLYVVRKENMLLALTSLTGTPWIGNHLESEFLVVIRCRLSENEALSYVDSAFTVSGNSATKKSNSYASIRSEHGFRTTIYGRAYPEKVHIMFNYFEVTIDTVYGDIYVGMAALDDFPINKAVGECANYLGIGRYGTFYQSGTRKDNFGPGGFAQGDTVGCGLMAVNNKGILTSLWLFFTKNGKIWGTPAVLPMDTPTILYPTVSFYRAGDKVTANLGNEPFKYEIPPAEGLLCLY